MKLLTIILNFRTPALTLRAVDSAARAMEKWADARIDVVDNDSQDGSFEALRAGLAAYDPRRVRLLASPRNGGFGAGNNYAIRLALAEEAPPELIYILNSDAFPDSGAIEALVGFLDAHPQAGLAGSYIYGVDGVPHETAFRFPTVWSEIESGLGLGVVSRLLEKYRVPILPMPSETREVDWLAGASLMMRASVLREIGLFDEQFFLYFEETDLCRRAKRAGHSTWYVVDSRVAHVGSASTGMKKWRRIPRYWLDSRAHYFEKNHGAGYLRTANLAAAVALGIFRVRRAVQRKSDPHPPGYYGDFVRYNLLGDTRS